MSKTLRRCLPLAVLCIAMLLGGCVVVPARPYYYGPHWHWWR